MQTVALELEQQRRKPFMPDEKFAMKTCITMKAGLNGQAAVIIVVDRSSVWYYN